jgi:hypothetical protein
MTAHNFTGTATDTMGAAATDTLVVNSTATAAPRVVRRSFMDHRISWGPVIDQSIKGPTFSDTLGDGTADRFGRTSPPDSVTLGLTFEVLAPVRFTGCRIYKAPNATGTAIPVKLWSGTGTELATATIPSWTVDAGGWRQVTFPAPVNLTPGVGYTIGYLSGDGIFAWSPWVWHAQDTCVWPLLNRKLADSVEGSTQGSVNGFDDAGDIIAFPSHHIASNYYIDPQVEWDEPMPAFTGGTGYWDQWTNSSTVGGGRHAFPVAVFFSDPPYLEEYYEAGVNTLMAGAPVGNDGPAYIDAMNSFGNVMDWWPSFLGSDPAGIVRVMADEPAIAAQIVGYHLDDEPDMSVPYRPPSLLRGWANGLRSVDSTRPIVMGMGRWAIRNQSFQWAPQGATAQTVNELWREWTACGDLITCDDYTLTANEDPLGVWGIWAYALHVGRMNDITDSSKPVWVTVETTSGVPGKPLPEEVRKAIWATLIAGAKGVLLFDHRFGSDLVTQDFAALLHNAPMKAMVTALAARLQTLGPALHAPEANLVTATTSSNTTAGPLGGTYGVPLHYTTRIGGGHQYLFAMGIRPGATTATFTIPSWANQTVTVIDESRTVTVSAAGVLTDTFAADYTTHLYQRG